jgi:hypothetical protein
MEPTVQGYTLIRLDEIQAMLREILANQTAAMLLLQVRPAAAETVDNQPLLSRLKNWLDFLKPLGTMAVKQVVTIVTVWYLLKGGDAFQAAEVLLKLL